MSKFDKYKGDYNVVRINDAGLELRGGGDFYPGGGEPDKETWDLAKTIAADLGMRITYGEGRWDGWTEYTPDAGDVSVFTWESVE